MQDVPPLAIVAVGMQWAAGVAQDALADVLGRTIGIKKSVKGCADGENVI